jgi:hypothetical protein
MHNMNATCGSHAVAAACKLWQHLLCTALCTSPTCRDGNPVTVADSHVSRDPDQFVRADKSCIEE